jgi:hypothetical protein
MKKDRTREKVPTLLRLSVSYNEYTSNANKRGSRCERTRRERTRSWGGHAGPPLRTEGVRQGNTRRAGQRRRGGPMCPPRPRLSALAPASAEPLYPTSVAPSPHTRCVGGSGRLPSSPTNNRRRSNESSLAARKPLQTATPPEIEKSRYPSLPVMRRDVVLYILLVPRGLASRHWGG